MALAHQLRYEQDRELQQKAESGSLSEEAQQAVQESLESAQQDRIRMRDLGGHLVALARQVTESLYRDVVESQYLVHVSPVRGRLALSLSSVLAFKLRHERDQSIDAFFRHRVID